MEASKHNVKAISVVNPELATLISKVQVVHLLTGGQVVSQPIGEKISKYEKIKLQIKSRLDNIDQIQSRLSSGLYDVNSKDYISMKNTLRTEFQMLVSNIEEFNTRSKSHTSDEEIKIQKEIIVQANSILPAHKKFLNSESKPSTTTVDDIIAGVHIKKQKPITGLQLEVISEINQEQKIQDELLDDISASLHNLRQIAINATDLLQYQNEKISVVIDKTDKTSGQLDVITEKTSNVLTRINSRSGKICAYIFCLFLLLSLGSVAFKIMS
jgi:hypothetical protein